LTDNLPVLLQEGMCHYDKMIVIKGCRRLGVDLTLVEMHIGSKYMLTTDGGIVSQSYAKILSLAKVTGYFL
jgi:hypothetical protein